MTFFSSTLLPQDPGLQTDELEQIVENWLNKNQSWFKCYAIENLDLSTVQKWLRLNGNEICTCKSKIQKPKALTAFQRRKSVTYGLSSTSKFDLAENVDAKKSVTELRRYYSFNSLLPIEPINNPFQEETTNEYLKKLPKVSFNLESDFTATTQPCAIDDTSEEGTRTLGVNSKLLNSLIKTRIKVPNKGICLSLEEKMCLKREKTNIYELLVHFINDVSKEIFLKDLNDKIINNLKIMANVEYTSLFFVDKPRQRFVSFKCDPLFPRSSRSILSNQNISLVAHEFEQEIPMDSPIFNYVVETGNHILLDADQIKDIRYKSVGDQMSNIKIKSVLCLPIKNVDKEVIAVVQLTNKLDGPCFREKDLKWLYHFLEFISTAIIKAQIYDLCAYEYDRNTKLLEVLHDIFCQQIDMDKILFNIMEKAQTLLNCQRCSVLIMIDNGESSLSNSQMCSKKAFDVYQVGTKPEHKRHSVVDDDGRRISVDLVNYVISTGKKINIKDAYLDPRFDPKVDSEWGFRTKSKLIVPIKNLDGAVIGCARVSNRVDNQPFDESDEQLLETFSVFCGLAINNTLIYNQLEKSMAEKSVALEVLSYHAYVSKNDLTAFLNKYPDTEDFSSVNKLLKIDYLSSYLFDDFCLDWDDMVLASYEMFKQSGLMQIFKIDKMVFFHWILTVRKNYRDVDYHNWNHAFNVCQSMISIFSNSTIAGYLQEIEKLALIVGCLCHDLDHRGTNNLFQIESHSPLSQLYGTTATMEKHHFNHCIMILNSPGHNIFSNIKPKVYQLLISLIKDAILATDLADHFSVRNDFEEAVLNKETYWTEEKNSTLLRKNLMTCCDLASVAKPWPVHKKIVNLVTKEFFAQGDRERYELHIEPNEMMDARRSNELPRLQINWIDRVCYPLYKNFATLCRSFDGHLDRIADNRRNWSLLNEQLKENLLSVKEQNRKETSKESN